jgi:hypothetical protein
MNSKSVIKYAFIHALVALVYIGLVALLIANGETLFGKMQGALAVSAFLLTLVVSVAVMGVVIFGRPLMWYLDSKKKEGVELALCTIGFLLLIVVMVFVMLAVAG